ncbi:MAG TPA: VapC toxin family PIN domain ribonuclease [Agrobacterium sp.]|uniref:type II toxin-antitoxin system VapC family toxin n=1 Tax=Rhizobium sp. TaxID=391 RepID=UPI000E8681C3|nr:VapC toxin family PIN domain ribonuclease [Agrobacterium sp.]
MIRYILDTNAVIALIGRKSDRLVRRIFDSEPGSLAVSSVVVHELYYGAYKSSRVEHNLETLRLLLADFAVLDIDQNDAVVSGAIRASLAMRGAPIGPYDVLIAGQAKARNLVLATNNFKEFERVDGLSIEDWTK